MYKKAIIIIILLLSACVVVPPQDIMAPTQTPVLDPLLDYFLVGGEVPEGYTGLYRVIDPDVQVICWIYIGDQYAMFCLPAGDVY